MLRHVILVLVLLAPGASAAARVEGDARFDAPLRLDADASIEADAGYLDLASAARPDAGLVLSWTRMEGRLVTNAYADPGLPGPVHPQLRGERSSEPVRHGPGALANLTCWDPCQVLLVAEGAGVVGLAGGRAAGDVAWTREATHRHAGVPARGDPYGYWYDVGAGWLLADAAADARDALPVPGAVPVAEGRLTLLLVNVTGDVRADGARHALDARATTTRDLVGTRDVGRFYALRLEGARLDAPGPLPVRLGAPSWLLQIEGEAASARATGRVDPGGAFEDARILLRGDLAWDMRVHEEEGALRDALALEASFAGRADLVRVGDAQVARLAPTPAGLAWGAALLALLLAAVALYSRLDPPRVAAHPHRQRLQEELRASPGLGPTELARRLDLARVVVQHHLHVLQRHGMVTRRERGTALAYYLPGDAPGATDVELPLAIRNRTTERLARALAAAPAPATQLDLSASTGIHPRLVSYHLGKLGRAGLVVAREGSPQRYEASPGFRDYLARRTE